ncbi:hypothetical protein HDU99_004663, partial [Rhizoclosmatium hyalinum]
MAGLQRGFSVLSLAASHSHPTLTAQTRSFPFAAVAIASQIRGNAGTKKKKLSAVVLRNE